MKKKIYRLVVFLTAISLVLGSCGQATSEPQAAKASKSKPETFQIIVKAENAPDGCYEIIYQTGDNEKAVKKGNTVKVRALVNNLKVNSVSVEKDKIIEIPVNADTTIEITYESNATNLTDKEKLEFDRELVEASHYTVLYSATSEERSNTLKEAVAKRIKHDSTVVSVDLDSDSGIYVAKLQNGSEEKSANLVVAEENDYCRMIVIPASGDITLGGGACQDENPKHKANVKPYKLAETLVTQKLFAEIMDFNPSVVQGNLNNGEDENLRPVDSVNWFTAAYFCNKLTDMVMGKEHRVYYFIGEQRQEADPTNNKVKGIINAKVHIDTSKKGFRLPTGDEWEWAADCGDGFKYAGSNELNEVGWNAGNSLVVWNGSSDNVTHEVGKLKPNKFGLYDMTGNLWELSNDLLTNEQEPFTGTIATYENFAIQRGACAYCPVGAYPDLFSIKFLRANWISNAPDINVFDWKVGFRIACNAE